MKAEFKLMAGGPMGAVWFVVSFLGMALVLTLACVVGGCGRGGSAHGGAAGQASVKVLVSTAASRDVPVVREWVGTLAGSENADIRARVTGHLLSRDYPEGSLVKKGELLFEIDPRPFEVALAEARSQLEEGRARQVASQAEADRSTELFRKRVISEKEFINKTQLNKSAASKVEALEAAVEQARLNVGFCAVRSPLDGVAGVATAQVGDLVGTGERAVLTSVSVLDPMKLVFPISEGEYLMAGERLREGTAQPLKEREESIEVVLGNGERFAHRARLLAVDLKVSQTTGTILVTALLRNPGSVLRPGQFATARVIAKTLPGAVVVPQRAVVEVQGSHQLWVVDGGGKVEVRPVKVGVRDGGEWVIAQGLEVGERVVVEGTQQLKVGMVVEAGAWKPEGGRSLAADAGGRVPQKEGRR